MTDSDSHVRNSSAAAFAHPQMIRVLASADVGNRLDLPVPPLPQRAQQRFAIAYSDVKRGASVLGNPSEIIKQPEGGFHSPPACLLFARISGIEVKAPDRPIAELHIPN
jgi:hypothetical protein